MKDFNALIDNKPLADKTIKNKQEEFQKLFDMSRNKDYTAENLIDYLYHGKHKCIGIDLSRQTDTIIPPTNQLFRIIRRTRWCDNDFYRWKAAKNYSKLFFKFINCSRII